ncbi:olfactory receptor 1019-like [Notechis scutatus]|uniref:Olfactory receptor 1019-like n=1 Tax=Notechis scutatus TaxID=8663 RepID=A0A6J1VGJ5_9SAUR|nr:olfactory receptor 1019-like [Notechis scutatus]
MDKGNDSVITEFILQGFTDNPKMQLVLFFIFLLIYLIAVLGNIGMILLICTNTQLHKPMYYFLGNLSFVDLCCSSTVAPRMLIDLLSETKIISYNACATQLFFYVFFVDVECVLLAVMAYDRYVAICNPLLYSSIMSKTLCQQLIAFAYCIGLMDTIVYTSSTFLLTFCRSNLINHFFCDMPPLFVLSCSDTSVNEEMIEENHTKMTEFILVGLVNSPKMELLSFIVILIIYLITLTGNLGMIILIRISSQLQSPMYFFLSHLSFLDFGYSSAIAPKMLANILADEKSISYANCAAQMYFFIFCASTECILLAVMAYDRYVAICNPLLYVVTMSPKVCTVMVAGSYLIGLVNAVTQTASTFQLSFCDSHVINHFFCDVPPLLSLSCTDTSINEMVLFVFATILGIFTSTEIMVSYAFILTAILRINSSEGKQKAFSTCASHLAAVIIFYGTTVFMYLRPSSNYVLDQDKWASVFYTIMIPMLNPLIYSLRNKEVKNALRRLLNK